MSDSLKKWLIPGVLLLIIVGFVIYFLMTRESYNEVVARVNGEPITRRQVIEAIHKTDDNFKLDTLINRSIIEQLAQKNNITVSDAELTIGINNEVENITQNGESLEKYLKGQGISKEQFEDGVKFSILESKVVKGGAVTEEEITHYIEQHAKEYPAGPADEQSRQEVRVNLQTKISMRELRKKADIKTFPLFK